MQMLRNMPHLAIIPLVILWFGIDEEAKMFLVAIGVLFPIYLNTYHGIRTVDRGLIEMARVYGLSPLALFWRVILPGALPSILVGLRYALGIMWLTLIVAETISASSGIGYMTMNAREFLQTDVVLLGIIVYALLGKLADVAHPLARAPRLAWHPAYQSHAGAARMSAQRCRASLPERGCVRRGRRLRTRRTDVRRRRQPGGSGLPVRLEGRAKSFGEREVLHGLDLAIPPGQFVAVVGRSGGGKTTLLRLIAGLDTPTAGECPSTARR